MWIGALAIALLGGVTVYEAIESRTQSGFDGELSDAAVVWCDANRALLALSAESLGLLTPELADRPLNVLSDDSDDFADLTGETSLGMFRSLRRVAQETPPAAFGEIGFPTEPGFEPTNILGPRSEIAAAAIGADWLGRHTERWFAPPVVRACEAAKAAFGP